VGITPIKTPKLVKKVLPNYIWDIPTTENVLYLTFDDGPTPNITSWVLETLNQFNAKATFFCIGKNIEKHPDIFKKILAENHIIGNHTQNHIKGWKSSIKEYLTEVSMAQEIINSQLGQQDLSGRFFRPPYGQIKPSQGKALMALGYSIIMWQVLSFDWDKNTPEETCLSNVITKSKPGSIIVFHDSVKASKNLKFALPRVLEHFSKKGYTFKALPA
jgi:peptidoglycan/xylan/chitin deacetylase (PgdA/CDA1 family)